MAPMLSRRSPDLRGFSQKAFRRLAALGFGLRVVYDISSHQGNWTKALRIRSACPWRSAVKVQGMERIAICAQNQPCRDSVVTGRGRLRFP